MQNDFDVNQKISYGSNLLITILVVLMMVTYYLIGAKILAYYSIFVTVVYLINFILIYKKKLRAYVWTTYTMLTLYMSFCTVMLGYNYGFQLYLMSTIPLIYYIKYISIKIHADDPKPVFWTCIIVFACVSASLFSVIHGPIYDIEGIAPIIFLTINMLSVCFFIFVFSRRMVCLVVDSENKLEEQANHDALTGLANRYLMRKILIQSINEMPGETWLAMVDIDKFKSINDTYGHNMGDEVLKFLGKTMIETCPGCMVSRWGGEEFIIYGKTNVTSPEIIETLRKKVEDSTITFGQQVIKFTITSGVSVHEPGQQMDKWVISADDKLYYGKEHGRNQVVY